jgi:hypothetical protein
LYPTSSISSIYARIVKAIRKRVRSQDTSLTTAQIRAAEELLSLSRELKEMWLVGRLRELGQGEEEGKIDEDAKMVGELVEKAIALRDAHGGGDN